jgi:hypothetical protein
MNNVTNPSSFIGASIHNEIIVKIFSTFKMTQTPHPLKSKTKVIIIGHIDLAPRMTIILPNHALHLIKMVINIIN